MTLIKIKGLTIGKPINKDLVWKSPRFKKSLEG